MQGKLLVLKFTNKKLKEIQKLKTQIKEGVLIK